MVTSGKISTGERIGKEKEKKKKKKRKMRV